MFNRTHKTAHIEKPHNQGQSLVEFAMIVGLMVVILLGAIDIFNLLQQKADLDKMVLQAARQAGEFGGSGPAGDGKNEIKAFIRAQMESIGYETAEIDVAVNSLVLEAQTFNEVSKTFDLKAGTTLEKERCQYGEFISVAVTVPWVTNIPLVLFFNGFNGAGNFEIIATARCWRAL